MNMEGLVDDWRVT